jgi:transcriptional regulator NrdR family protein
MQPFATINNCGLQWLKIKIKNSITATVMSQLQQKYMVGYVRFEYKY